MSKVIQVRDVPDDVHDALTAAAAERGQSLTRYVLGELAHVAQRGQVVQDNASVFRETRSAVGRSVDRTAVLEALRQGRGE